MVVFALAAMASPIRYGVTATDATTGITITGGFTLDGGSLTTWSFNLAGAAGTYSDFGSGYDHFTGGTWQKFQAVDNSGGYSLDTEDGIANVNFGSIIFEAYNGDGGDANPNTSTSLDLVFSVLPGSLRVSGSSSLSQCTSCNGVYNFTDYFTSGQITELTPEPPAWTLAGTGLLLLAGVALWSDRRRAAARLS